MILDLIRYHHERWDGKGYPYGYAGEDIPAAARYFSVIDSFDAMTSVRPYRHEVGREAAKQAIFEVKAGSGTRYAPDAVTMFCELFESGRLDWILHYFNDDSSLPEYSRVEEVHTSYAVRTGA